MDVETEQQIVEILNRNKVNDLNKFLEKRSCLNTSNQWLNYCFNLIQGIGIFLVSLGQAYENPYFIWSGVACNSISSIIHIYENNNVKLSKTLLYNIKQIKMNKYVDESMIDLDAKSDGTPSDLKSSTPNKLSFDGINDRFEKKAKKHELQNIIVDNNEKNDNIDNNENITSLSSTI